VRLHDAARKLGRELLIEIICGKHGELKDDTTASIMDHLYQLKIKPDWWKLEAQPSSHAWTKIEQTITTHDPLCRGIMMLGLDAPESHRQIHLVAATTGDLVKGFAIGRVDHRQGAAILGRQPAAADEHLLHRGLLVGA